MKQKNRKADFLISGTLAASILGNALTGKGVLRASEKL